MAQPMNIFNYYAAYKLTVESQAMPRKARESLSPSETRSDEMDLHTGHCAVHVDNGC